MIMLILMGASIFSYAFTLTHLTHDLVQWVGTLEVSRWVVIVIILAGYILLGSERAADWQAIGALVTACRMAGAIGRMLDMSARHARDREQFGRPIGKFQAIQQQVSVLAEHAHAAHMAAQLACRPGPDGPAHVLRDRVAIAKVQVGMSAAIASSIAHAVHGAIGMSEEFDLHLYSGLVQRGRVAFGSERYWATALGTGLLRHRGRTALEEVRRLSDPSST